MKRKISLWLALVLIVTALMAGAGVSSVSNLLNGGDIFTELNKFKDVLSLVQQNYVDTVNIRDLFDADNSEVLALAQRVFDKCVLEKLQPPVEPLQHTWVRPGGPYYNGQWIWDTMFVVDLLSILPGQKQVIRDIFQNHLLQLLALTAMEPPIDFDADAVRNEKAKVLRATEVDEDPRMPRS